MVSDVMTDGALGWKTGIECAMCTARRTPSKLVNGDLSNGFLLHTEPYSNHLYLYKVPGGELIRLACFKCQRAGFLLDLWPCCAAYKVG